MSLFGSCISEGMNFIDIASEVISDAGVAVIASLEIVIYLWAIGICVGLFILICLELGKLDKSKIYRHSRYIANTLLFCYFAFLVIFLVLGFLNTSIYDIDFRAILILIGITAFLALAGKGCLTMYIKEACEEEQ